MPYNYYLSIAGIGIHLESDHPLVKNRDFEPFFTEKTEAEVHAVIRKTDRLPDIPENAASVNAYYRAVADGRGAVRKFFLEKFLNPVYYAAATYDAFGKEILVEYLEDYIHCVSEVKNSFYHLGFASLLLLRDKLCLHASCVETALGGLLFSGVSGIGKSTQADLWCRYRGAKQINGDRPILSKEEGCWMAWGSPYAGSSRCHVNESCPVTAIILLKQAEVCSVRRLTPSEAFRKVWAGMTVETWNPAYVERASLLTMDLVAEIPVLEFSCTPDEGAVAYLEQMLRKEFGI